MWNQHLVAYVLRRLGLIKLGYYAVFSLDFLHRLLSNWRYAREHPDIPAPPPLRRFETNYDTDLRRFVEGGGQDARMFYELAKLHLPDGSLTVYEWGCGVGRLIRHMPNIDPPRIITVYGTDYKAPLIDWCRRNIE